MITITLAPCVGVDKPFAAVTKETIVFSGADVADGLQAALFDGSGTCLAVADVQDAQATLDLDTQEAVDATAPVGPGEAVSVWLVVGDKDTHIATVPCLLIRNLIDDEATHPHVPAERYPTVSELEKWLEAAGEVREGVCTCAKAAASSAEAAATSAETAAKRAEDAAASAKAASVSAEQAQTAAEKVGDFSDHLEDHDNPHHVTAAQVGALTETTANGLYPRFRDEDATTTVGNNHGRNVMASQNGEEGGFYVTGVAGNPPSRKQWLTEYQRDRVRVYTATSGESKDYYWDGTSSGDAEKTILRWCDLFAQVVTTVWRGIMRMCNPRIAANANDASKDIALVPNANGAGLQVQFPGGATAIIRMKTGTLATVQEVNEAIKNKQDKLVAGSGISIAEDGKTISATGGGGGTSVTIETTWPETPNNTTVPGTKLVKDYVDGLVGDINAALEEV